MRRVLFTLLASLGLILIAGNALAGANLTINDNASLNLGYRIQPQLIITQDNLDGDDELDSYRYFKVRRARFRLGAKVGDHMTAFLQTDVAGGGKPVEMIDAWVNFQVSPWLQFIMGRNMAPASRQNLTSSGALMTIDRPGMAYKSLTWGTRALYAFSNATFSPSDSQGLGGGPEAVRDNGLTLFGSGSLGSRGTSHLKYYAGIYNGLQGVHPETGEMSDKDRYTFRAQYNLWDGEAGYYNSSTYLGKKKTLGIGVSYDMQQEVVANSEEAKPLADYSYLEVDAFLELPFSGGSALTVEGGYMMLDFDDAADFLNTSGTGFYAQAGFYLASGFQPWVEFENWSSDADESEGGTVGNYTNFRVGVTYFLEGQAANIKLGYEQFKSDVTFLGEEDTISTFLLGFYTTY
jgi:hypothetical protein